MIAFHYDLFQTAGDLMESRYATVLLEAMAQNDTAVEVLGAYTDSPWLSPRWMQPMPRFAGSRWLFDELNQRTVRREAASRKPAVLLRGLHGRPLPASTAHATVALVHHFAPFRFPSPQNEKIQHRWAANLRSANGLIFSSRFAQQECYDLFPTSREKPCAVILPAGEAEGPALAGQAQHNTLLYCGPRDGHHNFSFLLQALHAAHGLEVLYFGEHGFNAFEKREMELLKRKNVVFKHIAFTRLAYFQALTKSSAVVNCSTYGGMDQAIFDALNAGCALWLSDTPAHREAGSMAYAYFNPFNAGELSALLQDLPKRADNQQALNRSAPRPGELPAGEALGFLRTFA